MKLFQKGKDGGPDSPVDGLYLIEIKPLFSIVLLKFNKGRRENFHTHAFNALTWFIGGSLEEEKINGEKYEYKRSFLPKITTRENNHRVKANKDSYCLTFRGPWVDFWTEDNKEENEKIFFTNGRKILKTESTI